MIEADDLMSATDVSQMLGFGASTISNWQRRHPDFPKPVATVANGKVHLFSRRQVVDWYKQRMDPRLLEELRATD